jgi:hypothetical protein
MQKRTRVFLVIAVGILFVGLGTGLFAAYRGGFQNLVLIGSDGPDELAYVPADAQLVAYADVRAIMDSDLRQRFRSQQPNPNQFQEQTGINPERDIDHVVVFGSGAVGIDQRNNPPVVLARGRFDAVRVEGAVRRSDGTTEDYKGIRVITAPDGHYSVAFVEPDLVAAGPKAAVHRAIDTKMARASTIRDNAEVMRLLRDSADGTAWAVARLDQVTAGGRVPPEVASKLPPVNWFAVTGRVDDGLRGTLRVEARDEAAARDLTDVVRGFMALARMQAGQRPEFASVLDSLQLSGSGNTVTLQFALPPQALNALASGRQQRRAQ